MNHFASHLRAARFTLVAFLSVCSLAVYAQAVDVVPVLPVTEAAPWSWQGTLMTVAFAVVLALVAAALGVWISFTSQKAKESKAWAVVNRASLAVQGSFGKLQTELAPQIKAALADGTITPEEWAEIVAKGLPLLKAQLGENLAKLPGIIGFDEAALPDFLIGMLHTAATKLAGGASVPVVPSVTVQNNVAPAIAKVTAGTPI